MRINESIKKEAVRKLFHLTTLSLVPIYLFFTKKAILFLGTLFLGLLMLLEYFRLKYSFLEYIARKEEKKRVASHVYAVFGYLIAIYVFPLHVAVYGIVIGAIGDSFSALTGKLLGTHNFILNKEKTIEGSIGGLLASYIFSLLLSSTVFSFGFYVISIVPLLVVLPDLFDFRLNDNLVLPFIVSLGVFLLSRI